MLFFPFDIRQAMIDHLRAEWPREGCGVILQMGQCKWTYVPLKNRADDPYRQYLLDPQEWVRIVMECEHEGWEIVAIAHSHPRSEAFPSLEDMNGWHYPGVYMVIVSFLSFEKPTIRVFRPSF